MLVTSGNRIGLVAPPRQIAGRRWRAGPALEVDDAAGTFTGGTLADAEDGQGDALGRRVRAFAAEAGVDSPSQSRALRARPWSESCASAERRPRGEPRRSSCAVAASENGSFRRWDGPKTRRERRRGRDSSRRKRRRWTRRRARTSPTRGVVRDVSNGARGPSAKSRAWTVMDPASTTRRTTGGGGERVVREAPGHAREISASTPSSPPGRDESVTFISEFLKKNAGRAPSPPDCRHRVELSCVSQLDQSGASSPCLRARLITTVFRIDRPRLTRFLPWRSARIFDRTLHQ